MLKRAPPRWVLYSTWAVPSCPVVVRSRHSSLYVCSLAWSRGPIKAQHVSIRWGHLYCRCTVRGHRVVQREAKSENSQIPNFETVNCREVSKCCCVVTSQTWGVLCSVCTAQINSRKTKRFSRKTSYFKKGTEQGIVNYKKGLFWNAHREDRNFTYN